MVSAIMLFQRLRHWPGLEEDDLMACNLGYRSKYVVRAAKAVSSGEVDLAWIDSLNYQKARTELLKLFGVGEKVADCICLFALHHLDAFPVDTHIRQVLEQHYKRGFPEAAATKAFGALCSNISFITNCMEVKNNQDKGFKECLC